MSEDLNAMLRDAVGKLHAQVMKLEQDTKCEAPLRGMVVMPEEVINSAAMTLEANGDEHGVAKFLRAALAAAKERSNV